MADRGEPLNNITLDFSASYFVTGLFNFVVY